MTALEAGAMMLAAIKAADQRLELNGKLIDQFELYRSQIRCAAAEAERGVMSGAYAAGQLRDLLGEERRR